MSDHLQPQDLQVTEEGIPFPATSVDLNGEAVDPLLDASPATPVKRSKRQKRPRTKREQVQQAKLHGPRLLKGKKKRVRFGIKRGSRLFRVVNLQTGSPVTRHPVRKSRRNLERARRRQMNYLQQRRKQKQMRLIYNRIRNLLKLLFVFLWLLIIWEVLQTPFWVYDAPRLTLTNANLLNARNIQPFIQPYAGQPIYRIDPRRIAEKLKARYSIIDQVYVRRHLFPARLEVVVIERSPWAELYRTDKPNARPYALAAKNNSVVPLASYRYVPHRAKPITKPSAAHAEAKPLPSAPAKPVRRQAPEKPTYKKPLTRIILPPTGKQANARLIARLETLAYQLQHIQGLHLVRIDASHPTRIQADFEEVQVLIGRPDAEMSHRLARLVPLVPKIRELQGDIEKVDLRWGGQVTFHKATQASPAVKPE